VHGLGSERSSQPYDNGAAGCVALDDGRLDRFLLRLQVSPSFLEPGE
jgi:hypothetical protein